MRLSNVCPINSPELHRHIHFHDALRAREELRLKSLPAWTQWLPLASVKRPELCILYILGVLKGRFAGVA